VSAVFSDDSVEKQFSLDGQIWQDYTGAITFEDNGAVLFLARDLAGNFSYASYTVENIDKVAPDAPVAMADITKVTNTDVSVTAAFSTDSVVKDGSAAATPSTTSSSRSLAPRSSASRLLPPTR
jgi:hypothetical protein